MPQIIPGIYLIMRERTYIYKSMSELYRGKPSKPLLEAVSSEEFVRLGQTIGEEFEHLKRGHELVCNFIKQFKEMPQIENAVHREYEEIFSDPVFALQRTYDASSGEAILASLKEFFGRESWTPPEDFPTEPDHISVECEFMVHLCAKSRRAIIDRKPDLVHENLYAQRDFLHKHICNWIPALSKELAKRAKSDFYRGLAELTDGFIAVDKDVFNAIMEMAG